MGEKRNLIIARVGDRSLHREWLQPAEFKNFDLCLSYYGDKPDRYAHDGEYYFESKGTKWPKLYELMESLGDSILEYDAIWFPDDDISTNAQDIARMFDLFHEQELILAQPALSQNAFFQVTVRHIDYKLRYTHFVEVMVPIFSKEALRVCWPTFRNNLTGWGLEHVWAKLLNYPHKKIAILDETPVKHTRPPGQGDLYSNIRSQLNINILDNNETKMLEEYGIVAPEPSEIKHYDGIRLWDPIAELLEKSKRESVHGKRLRRRKIRWNRRVQPRKRIGFGKKGRGSLTKKKISGIRRTTRSSVGRAAGRKVGRAVKRSKAA